MSASAITSLTLVQLACAAIALGWALAVVRRAGTLEAPGDGALDVLDAEDGARLGLARYVGGHPACDEPLSLPTAKLGPDALAIARRRGNAPVFAIAWRAIEDVALLDARQMRMAAGSVRGMAPDALDDVGPEAAFLRVRYVDDRGWWQNVIFELLPGRGQAQHEAVVRRWREHGPPG